MGRVVTVGEVVYNLVVHVSFRLLRGSVFRFKDDDISRHLSDSGNGRSDS